MKLTVNERGPFTDVIKLDYRDLDSIADGIDPFTGATLATAGQLVIATKPAYGGVYLAQVAEVTALAGASDITFDIGTTAGDPDEYIDALDVDAMTAPVANTGDAFNDGTTAGVINVVDQTNAAESIILEVNGTTGDLTAGEVIIGLGVTNLGDFNI